MRRERRLRGGAGGGRPARNSSTRAQKRAARRWHVEPELPKPTNKRLGNQSITPLRHLGRRHAGRQVLFPSFTSSVVAQCVCADRRPSLTHPPQRPSPSGGHMGAVLETVVARTHSGREKADALGEQLGRGFGGVFGAEVHLPQTQPLRERLAAARRLCACAGSPPHTSVHYQGEEGFTGVR